MTIEQVKIEITADGSQVGPVTAKAKKDVAGIGEAADKLGISFGRLGGIIGGALSVGAFAGFLAKVNSGVDALNDLAQRSNASASGLQALQLAAQQAGGSAEAIAPALGKMATTIGDAMAGSKTAAAAFQHLGLSVADLSKMKADEAFRTINQSLSELGNSFERTEAGRAIFGKGYSELAGLAVEGQSAIDAVTQALEAQGAALSDLDVAKVGVMNDELALQTQIVENLGAKFLAGLAPAMGVATGALSEMLGSLGGASSAGEKFGVIMTASIKAVESSAYMLAAVFEKVRSIIAGVLSAIVGGVSDIIGAFGVLAEGVGLDKMGASLRRGQEVMSGISESLGDISARASANATAAGVAAIQAATEIVNASTIFAAAQAEYERKAAEAAARNAAAQGGGSGYQAPAGAATKAPQTLEQMQRQALGALDKTVTSQAFTPAGDLKFDPASDLEAFTADARFAYLQQKQDEHNATMLGKLETFNSTWLGSMLVSNQAQIDAEQFKNLTIGDMMSNFANMAMQHGGALGKVGKAIAIAQTIWATASAVMQSYQNAGGYPLGIAPAAAMAAVGLAQLANIKKTNVGSGGSIASAKGGGGGGSSTSPFPTSVVGNQAASTESDQKSAVQIVVNGNLFAAQETVDWFIGQLSEAVNGKDVVFMSGNSRQALEFAPA